MKKNALIVYRMAWTKCALMAFGGGSAAFVTAMSGVTWSHLSGTERVCVILGCIGSMTSVVIAFLDRTIARIEAEQQAIPGTPEHEAALAKQAVAPEAKPS